MTRRSQASVTNSRTSYESSAPHEATLVLVLGQMLAHQQAHTTATHTTNELLHGVSQHLSSLPDQIALRMPKHPTQSNPQEPKPSAPPGKVIPAMKALKELIWSITPLALLTAVVMGKLTWTDALPVIRQMLGMH